jgi:hypothetical protein
MGAAPSFGWLGAGLDFARGRRWLAEAVGAHHQCPVSLRVFGCLPITGVTGCREAGVRKAWKEETAAGVCASAAVGLWGFSAWVCFDYSMPDREGVGAGAARVVPVAPGAGGKGDVAAGDLCFGGGRQG